MKHNTLIIVNHKKAGREMMLPSLRRTDNERHGLIEAYYYHNTRWYLIVISSNWGQSALSKVLNQTMNERNFASSRAITQRSMIRCNSFFLLNHIDWTRDNNAVHYQCHEMKYDQTCHAWWYEVMITFWNPTRANKETEQNIDHQEIDLNDVQMMFDQ